MAGAIVLAACGEGRRGVEGQIAGELGRQLGVAVKGVRCPAGAMPKVCTATIGTAEIPVRVSDGEGGVVWEVDGFVIATAPLEIEIGIELDDLGIEAEVDCGAEYRVTEVGERIGCELAIGGVKGAAWARIRDEEGRFDVELAIDPAAAAARTQEIDEAELERRSRELDVEAGEEDDQP